MKKWLIILIVLVLVLLISLCVFLVMRFASLASSVPETEAGAADPSQIEAYAREHWPQYSAIYDTATQTLTLTRTTQLSYEEACLVGAMVYSDSTAPETYLDDASAIALNVMSEYQCPDLTVNLSFLSTEGDAIFTVCSDGTVETCWE